MTLNSWISFHTGLFKLGPFRTSYNNLETTQNTLATCQKTLLVSWTKDFYPQSSVGKYQWNEIFSLDALQHEDQITVSTSNSERKHETISVLISRLIFFLSNAEICVMLECHQDQITTLGSLEWFDLAYCWAAGNEIHATLSTHTRWKMVRFRLFYE